LNLKFNYATLAVGFFIGLTFISVVAKNNGKRRFTTKALVAAAPPADTPKLKFPIQDAQTAGSSTTNPFQPPIRSTSHRAT
jgi:hypothetical protein